MAPDLHAKMLAMEDFLNEPKRAPDIEPIEVRDYRHEAYRVWSPLCQTILTHERTMRALCDALEALCAGSIDVSGTAIVLGSDAWTKLAAGMHALEQARGEQPTPLREGEL